MFAGRRPVVVSLTPLPLSADSRTLKQVTSVHRFGFESIAIEGKESGFGPGALPLKVISTHSRDKARASSAASSKSDAAGSSQGSATSSSKSNATGKSQRIAGQSVVAVPCQTTEAFGFRRLRQSVLERLPVGYTAPSQLTEAFRKPEKGQSTLRRFAVRFIPGCQTMAYLLRQAIERAIAARRNATQVSGGPSVREIIRAFPHGMRLFLVALARRGLSYFSWMFRFARIVTHPRAFAGHLSLYFKQYFFTVLSVTPRADVYYLHAFYQFPAVFVLCLRYRAKMIYDAHDFYSQLEDDAGFSSYWKNWVLPFERVVERACVWFADEVVTVNEGIAALMRERFGCKPVILRNVHDLRLDSAPATTIREQIGLPVDAFLVVSIGNWKPGMAMEQMFDALAALPKHVHLAFLGGGYPCLDDAISSRGIQGRVHLVKPVMPQEVVPFIASADASVVLYYGKSVNYQNALPNRFFQSIAAKLPLVYPDLNEIRRLAERYGVGIMADPQKPADIASALRTLIEDDQRRLTIRKNLVIASRELSWEGEEQVLSDLLNRHLGKAKAPLPSVRSQTVA